MQPLVEFCRALGSERRFQLYQIIHEREGLAVCDLAEEMGLSEPATCFHLKKLLRVGLIKQSRIGKFTVSSH